MAATGWEEMAGEAEATETRLSTDARRAAVMELARHDGMVRVADLSARFGVSEVSIRRDLAKLEEYGLLRRVRGGALALGGAPLTRAYEGRCRQRQQEKERIGRAAAALVRPGDHVILDSGTTVLQVARHLAATAASRRPLTVITASLPAFRELALVPETQLFLLGGMYLPDHQTLVGPQTLAALRGFHVHRLFLGTDGLSFDNGVTTANVLEAEVSRAMIAIADEVVVVTDASKVGVAGLTSILPLAGIGTLVTDAAAPDGFVAALRGMGVEVVLA